MKTVKDSIDPALGSEGAAQTPAATELAELRRWLFDLPQDAVCSFDIFDTTVTRIWRRPEDLFVALGAILQRRGIVPMPPMEFAETRRAAEAAARRSHASGEATLEEIYAQLGEAKGLDATTVAAIAAAEIDLEARSIRPIAGVVALQKELELKRRQLVLTSDTYHSTSAVTSILAAAGVETRRKLLFLSSEKRASKQKGDLYQKLRSSDCGPSSIHIGDRSRADLVNARRAGFDSRLFAGQREWPYERALGAAKWSDALAGSAASGCARAARLQGDGMNAHLEVVRGVGADVAGPLLCAFVAWVLKSAAAAGVDRLLFLARDGQILQRLAGKLAPAMGIAIDCRYAYASRQALYLPSVREVGDIAWQWLCAHMEGSSAGQILGRFGLDDAASTDFLHRNGLSKATPVDAGLAARLTELLARPELTSRILDVAARRRALALEYFRGEIGSASRPAIVDVGWKGRLQVALQRILATEPGGIEIDGYYFALDGSARPPSQGQRMAFVPYSKVPNTILMETFTLADHGSVTGFRRTNDGATVEPILAAAVDQASIDWGVREQQAAILDFADFLLDAAKLAGFDPTLALAELKEPALKCFATFVNKPTFAEATAYGDLEHSDDQAHHNASAIGGPLSLRELVLLAVLGSTPFGRRITYWPQASLRRFGATNPAVALSFRTIAQGRMAAERIRRRLSRVKRRVLRWDPQPSKS